MIFLQKAGGKVIMGSDSLNKRMLVAGQGKSVLLWAFFFCCLFLHDWQHILLEIAGCQCSCKLRHRAFGTCTFYASETRINTGFLKVLLQNAHFVHVSTLFFLPCRTLQNAHFMGNCAIASPSSADFATERKRA
jgi:hypothetical protein